ncbi:MAG: translation initiation factor 2 [Synechococcus sp. NP17]|jgi:hypothetical protein|nr:translation initiation factor 2 [Synechococcus sp. NP17]|tara:strand:+ start:4223 stop:4714 length:492 start_codon:yes stop_codon:yes gene_type:complete
MVLKRKGFFLNLEESTSTEQAIVMAPVRDLPDEDSQEEAAQPVPAISKTAEVSGPGEKVLPRQSMLSAPVGTKSETELRTPVTSATQAEPQVEKPPEASAASATTAEAIAAELAEAEASRPVVMLSTFAPDMLRPGRELRPERRRPGRNLKEFRDMTSELFSS